MIENNNDSVKNGKMLNESDQDFYKHTSGGNLHDDLSTKPIMIENNNDNVKNEKMLNESYKDCNKHTGGGNFRDDPSTQHSFNTVDKENEVKITGRNQISEFYSEDE